MKTDVKTSVYLVTAICIVVIAAVATQYGFAWTNPVTNPPAATSVITALGSNIGIGTATPGDKLEINGSLRFTPANPFINASSYLIIPGGAYFNSGFVYAEAPIQARGGLHNDTGSYLVLQGGTTGKTQLSGALRFPDGTEQASGGQAGLIATSGWTKLPSGLIMQWGTSPIIGQAGFASIVFPIAFPNEVFNVQISNKNVTGYNEQDLGRAALVTATGFNLQNSGWAPGSWGAQYYWMAIGY